MQNLTFRDSLTYPMFCLLILCLTVSSISNAKEISYPLDIVVTNKHTIYVADRNLPGIWEITNQTPSVYYQAAKQFRTPLNAIRCLAIDEKGRLLAGDSATREIYRFDKNHKPLALTNGKVGIPMSIAVSKAGTIYVADLETHRIWEVPSAGGEPQEVAQVHAPRDLAIDSQGLLWIVSHGPRQIVRLNPKDGAIEPIVKGMPFQFAHQLVLEDDSTAYVVDGYAKTIWKVQMNKSPQPFAIGDPLKNPVGLARTKTGFLVTDTQQKTIYGVTTEGKISAYSLKVQPRNE